MQGTIQFVQVSPEQFEERLSQRLKLQFDALKQEFQPKQPTEYLTRDQVKEMFQVDMSTIHNWTKRGKLKSYGIGNRVYYKRSEVEGAVEPLSP